MTNREMAVVAICAGIICLTDDMKLGAVAQFVHKILNKYVFKHKLIGNTISIPINEKSKSDKENNL